jgi:hypothetical protein
VNSLVKYWRAVCEKLSGDRKALAASSAVALLLIAGAWGIGAQIYSHIFGAKHHRSQAVSGLFSPESKNLPLPFVHIAAGPNSLFAPFKRKEVTGITLRWRYAKMASETSGVLAYAENYEDWKKRAKETLAAENSQQARGIAGQWITGYESEQRKQFLLNGSSRIITHFASMPTSLALAAGTPPQVFRGFQNVYTIFLPGVVHPVILRDHPLKDGSKYMIYPEGVMDKGNIVASRPNAAHIMRKAGLSEEQKIVFMKVSEREGGFEAVNTYDAGYLSVGFIQFASMRAGSGSLVNVLERMKKSDPVEYNHYFRYYGVDVAGRKLVVVDPITGSVLKGADAVDAVRREKRLTAVFYHAGASSEAFQAAQIAQAAQTYYAPSHSFSIPMAEMIDNSDPWRPVTTYLYGDEEIQQARQLVHNENLKPWTPPAPKPIPLAPPVPITPAGGVERLEALPPIVETSKTGKNQNADSHANAQDAPKTSHQDLGAAQDAEKSQQNQTASQDRQEAENNQSQTNKTPVPKAPELQKLPNLPYVDGAPTHRQVRRSAHMKALTMAMTHEYTPPPYTGPHFKIVRLPNLEGKYGDIFRSQAGEVAITDRCIQRGFGIGGSKEGLAGKFIQAISLTAGGKQMTIESLRASERDLIEVVQNRILTLADTKLSQPPIPSEKQSAKAITKKRRKES